MNNLPQMTVEQRESQTAHGIKPPNLENVGKEIQDCIQLNQDAITSGWKETTLSILIENIPFSVSERDIIIAVSRVTGFDDWKQLSRFVVDDQCTEFFNMALKYCLREGQVHQKEKGFIDGSGIGYVYTYRRRLKETLEQCFDAKYYYQRPRPLQYAIDNYDIDLSLVANAIHPGHWAYPAGHGTKFLTAVEVLRDVFHLDAKCYRELLVAACVASHGRSGNLIHYLQDNLAGGVLTDLKEFN